MYPSYFHHAQQLHDAVNSLHRPLRCGEVTPALGGHAWSACALGQARQQRCAQHPNAGHQARRAAGARHERTLCAVACMPLLGCWGPTRGRRRPEDRPPPPTPAPPRPPDATPPVGRGRWRLTRVRDQGGGHVAPPGPPPPPDRRLPPGCAWRPARPAARTRGPRTRQHAATPRAQEAVSPDHAKTSPARTGTRRQRRRAPQSPRRLTDDTRHAAASASAPLRRPHTPAGAHAAPVHTPGTIRRHGEQHACRLGPCLTPGLGRADVVALLQGHRCCSLERLNMVDLFLGPRPTGTLRPAAQRQASGAAASVRASIAPAGRRRLHALPGQGVGDHGAPEAPLRPCPPPGAWYGTGLLPRACP